MKDLCSCGGEGLGIRRVARPPHQRHVFRRGDSKCVSLYLFYCYFLPLSISLPSLPLFYLESTFISQALHVVEIEPVLANAHIVSAELAMEIEEATRNNKESRRKENEGKRLEGRKEEVRKKEVVIVKAEEEKRRRRGRRYLALGLFEAMNGI